MNAERVVAILRAIGLALVVLFGIACLLLLPLMFFVAQHAVAGGPDLFTSVDSGVRGEPINVVLPDGNLSAVVAGMEAQGWIIVPTFSPNNEHTWTFDVASGVTPISPRLFDGAIQAVALEGPNSTVFSRHHARFWMVNGTVYGAVSYDADVTVIMQGFVPLPTHVIGQDIDAERDAVGKTLAEALNRTMSYEENAAPALYADNGAGSWYYTDGEVLVLSKNASPTTLFLAARRAYFRFLGLLLDRL